MNVNNIYLHNKYENYICQLNNVKHVIKNRKNNGFIE